MDTDEDLRAHLLEEMRCQERVFVADGIHPEKLKLILKERGVSWEKIYETLFPGAPIPSACELPLGSLGKSSS